MSSQPQPQSVARTQWLAARRQHITSTDAPAILGQSSWASPLTIYCRKLGLESEPEATERMELGSAMQVPVAEFYARRTGRAIAHVEPFLLVKHPQIPWLASSLDAFQVDKDKGRGLLEVKLSDPEDKLAWTNEDNVPLVHQIQLQHELLVTGAAWGTLCCLLRGARLVYVDYDANPDFQKALVGVLGAFWSEHLCKQNPPVDGWEHPASKDAIRALYPEDAGAIVKLPPEAEQYAAEWDIADAELEIAEKTVADLKKRKDARANRLKLWMRDARYGVLEDGSAFAWKSYPRVGYMVEPCIRRDFRRVSRAALAKALKAKK